ncbi:ABC-2 family transporter protein [Silvanigrella paludirubra]|nr:ABC-2 family transporter protein [Silvanigrella paludirubra]
MGNIFHIFLNSLKLNISFLMKSKSNFYFMFFLQIFYYVVQVIFWSGIFNISNSDFIKEPIKIYGFLVTLAFIDNFYLTFFGSGSLNMQNEIFKLSLDNYLIKPIHPLIYFIFFKPNLGYFPGFILSIIFLISYYYYFNINLFQIFIHILSMLTGVFILNAISFIYRISCFWTNCLVMIKNSNPSFKIMVRPLESFEGKLRLFLLFVFPALFITGVPSSILYNDIMKYWLLIGFIMNIWIWILVYFLWKKGVKRYLIISV